jgi:hypothetical protein
MNATTTATANRLAFSGSEGVKAKPKTASSAGELYAELPDLELDVVRFAREVEKRTGKSPGRQMRELVWLTLAFPQIMPAEYYALHLYDDALSKSQRRRFMGRRRWNKLAKECNKDAADGAIINDKLAFNRFMEPNFPLARVKALFAAAGRAGKLADLRDEESLRSFLRDPANYPLFGKPMAASLSLGAAGFTAYDPESDRLETSTGEPVELDAFVSFVIENYSETGYLFQERVQPHSAIRAICGDRVPTIRVVTVGAGKIEIFGALWKIPAGQNAADNFWREGNLLAQLDPESGEVVRAFRGTGVDEEEVTVHPDTGAPLVGFRIPHWESVLQTARDAAEVFSRTPVLGWDMAVTEDGCLILEGNTRPDLRLNQMADRKGAYNDQLRAVVEHVKQQRKRKVRQGFRKWREFNAKNLRLARERKMGAH